MDSPHPPFLDDRVSLYHSVDLRRKRRALRRVESRSNNTKGNRTWIDLESPDPNNRFSSIPYAAFGPLLKFEFTGAASLEEILSCGWAVDNSIYSTSGGQSFDLYSMDVLGPLPTCTPPPNATATPTQTPLPWPNEPEKLPIQINIPNLPADVKPLMMDWIQAGIFDMGSPSDEEGRDSDERRLRVTISKGFYMGRYPVTQAQWETVMQYNPSASSDHPDSPVEMVSWNDCQVFINTLNQMDLGTFRLPTEAEWEYACRAGTWSRFYWGDDLDGSAIGQYAWYSGNSDSQTKEVGLKLPNQANLFDMSGNVWEWCQDYFGAYPEEPQIDPTGPEDGTYRVFRGGGWGFNADRCRSANRGHDLPDRSNGYLGFRLVRE